MKNFKYYKSTKVDEYEIIEAESKIQALDIIRQRKFRDTKFNPWPQELNEHSDIYEFWNKSSDGTSTCSVSDLFRLRGSYRKKDD